MTYEIIDNFLPKYQFKQLQSLIMSETFPWYYNDRIVDDQKNKSTKYQFIHKLYDIHESGPTEYVEFGDELKSKLELVCTILKANIIYKIKVNTRPRSFFKRSSGGYHTDQAGSNYTSILYMNTNNGYTKFKKGGKVKSVENRMVIFDGNLEHQGYSCTDKLRRVLINFKYER